MKKTFLAKRNGLLATLGVSWGGALLIVVVLLLALRLLAPNTFWTLVAPAFNASDAFARMSRGLFGSFGDSATLTLENETLGATIDALTLENASLKERLDGIAGLVRTPAGIIAGVLARPPASPYDTLVLAAGSREGVREGMTAYGAGGVPLGIVFSVLPDFSRISLLSSPGVTFTGSVGPKHLPLTLTGAGGGAFSASAPRAAEVAVGDTVFSPGPGSLPLGTVARIDSDPSSSSVSLKIMPHTNIFSISFVELRESGAALRAALASSTPLLP